MSNTATNTKKKTPTRKYSVTCNTLNIPPKFFSFICLFDSRKSFFPFSQSLLHAGNFGAYTYNVIIRFHTKRVKYTSYPALLQKRVKLYTGRENMVFVQTSFCTCYMYDKNRQDVPGNKKQTLNQNSNYKKHCFKRNAIFVENFPHLFGVKWRKS